MKTHRLDSLVVSSILALLVSPVMAASGDSPVLDKPVQDVQAVPPFAEARWIAPPHGEGANQRMPLLRKEFSVDAKPRKAAIRIVGLGDYDPCVNGQRLADTGINQPWTQYEKTIYYRDFDITSLVQPGANCVGVMLGSSFWHNPNPPKGRYNKFGPQREASEPRLLCAEVILEQGNGTIRRIGTDTTWRTTEGPIVFSHVYAAEDYDDRRWQPGWDSPHFDDSAWQLARVATAPTAPLAIQPPSPSRQARWGRVVLPFPALAI